MSAYGLQALLLAGRDGDAISVMRWLVTQRNKNGGFESTQDTVVGFQALSKLAVKIYAANSKMDITVLSDSSAPGTTINIYAANALVLQKFSLPSDARTFVRTYWIPKSSSKLEKLGWISNHSTNNFTLELSLLRAM